MGEFKLKFGTDNAAFEDVDFERAVAFVLRDVADRVRAGDYDGTIRDVNGNEIGSYTYDSE